MKILKLLAYVKSAFLKLVDSVVITVFVAHFVRTKTRARFEELIDKC